MSSLISFVCNRSHISCLSYTVRKWVSRTVAQSHSKKLTSLFPLIFLSKHISLYALGRIRWILDIIWPLNQHFRLKTQRNWLKQVSMLKFWSVINCLFMHWTKKLTLAVKYFYLFTYITLETTHFISWRFGNYKFRLHLSTVRSFSLSICIRYVHISKNLYKKVVIELHTFRRFYIIAKKE